VLQEGSCLGNGVNSVFTQLMQGRVGVLEALSQTFEFAGYQSTGLEKRPDLHHLARGCSRYSPKRRSTKVSTCLNLNLDPSLTTPEIPLHPHHLCYQFNSSHHTTNPPLSTPETPLHPHRLYYLFNSSHPRTNPRTRTAHNDYPY